MPVLRRLNDAGVREFAAYLDQLTQGQVVAPPYALLEDPRYSQPSELGAVGVVQRDFVDRRDFANYIDGRFQEAGVTGLADEPGLWEWLSLFYFNAVCPADSRGKRRPGATNRHLVNSAFARRRNRHLLRGPYMLYRRHSGEASELDLLLGYPLPVHGIAATHLAERPRLLGSRGVLLAANRLYFDTATKRPRRGYADQSSGLRAFCRFLNNLPRDFDLASISAETVLALLPGAFDAWVEGANEQAHSLRRTMRTPTEPNFDEPIAATLDGLLQRVQDRTLSTTQRQVRSELFRAGVVTAYGGHCAASGLGLASTVGDERRYEVEAAHIVPVAQGGRDVIQNGLALARTLHWAFDLGMVWVDERMQLAVANAVLLDQRNEWLARLRGRPIAVPTDARLRPHPEALRWHAAHVGGINDAPTLPSKGGDGTSKPPAAL